MEMVMKYGSKNIAIPFSIFDFNQYEYFHNSGLWKLKTKNSYKETIISEMDVKDTKLDCWYLTVERPDEKITIMVTETGVALRNGVHIQHNMCDIWDFRYIYNLMDMVLDSPLMHIKNDGQIVSIPIKDIYYSQILMGYNKVTIRMGMSFITIDKSNNISYCLYFFSGNDNYIALEEDKDDVVEFIMSLLDFENELYVNHENNNK